MLFCIVFLDSAPILKNSSSWLTKIVCAFLCALFFVKYSFDMGAFVKCFFVGVFLSTCLCRLMVGPIMFFFYMQFRCFVSLAWPLYKVFPILIFFIFSLTLMCSFVYILNVDIWQHVLVMSRMRCRVNPHSIVAWMSRNSQLKACCNWTWNQNHWVFVYELSSSRFNSSCSHLTFGLNNEWVHQTFTFKGKMLSRRSKWFLSDSFIVGY